MVEILQYAGVSLTFLCIFWGIVGTIRRFYRIMTGNLYLYRILLPPTKSWCTNEDDTIYYSGGWFTNYIVVHPNQARTYETVLEAKLVCFKIRALAGTNAKPIIQSKLSSLKSESKEFQEWRNLSASKEERKYLNSLMDEMDDI